MIREKGLGIRRNISMGRGKKELKVRHYFKLLPREIEVVILSLVLNNRDSWKRNWNNIVMVSSHWNVIAWTVFERTFLPKEKKEILLQACETEKEEFLLNWFQKSQNLDFSKENPTIFRAAIRRNHCVILQKMVEEKKIDPSLDGNQALIETSRRGETDTVQFLLRDRRVNAATRQNLPLCFASENGHVEVINCLLREFGVKPNEAIRFASTAGQNKIVKILLQHPGINRNIKNGFLKQTKITKYIDERGLHTSSADPNWKSLRLQRILGQMDSDRKKFLIAYGL